MYTPYINLEHKKLAICAQLGMTDEMMVVSLHPLDVSLVERLDYKIERGMRLNRTIAQGIRDCCNATARTRPLTKGEAAALELAAFLEVQRGQKIPMEPLIDAGWCNGDLIANEAW
jgi:hypothetical protein